MVDLLVGYQIDSLVSLFCIFLSFAILFYYIAEKKILKNIFASAVLLSNPYVLSGTFFLSLPAFKHLNEYTYVADWSLPLLYVLLYFFIKAMFIQNRKLGFVDLMKKEYGILLSSKMNIVFNIFWLLLLAQFDLNNLGMYFFPSMLFMVCVSGTIDLFKKFFYGEKKKILLLPLSLCFLMSCLFGFVIFKIL